MHSTNTRIGTRQRVDQRKDGDARVSCCMELASMKSAGGLGATLPGLLVPYMPLDNSGLRK